MQKSKSTSYIGNKNTKSDHQHSKQDESEYLAVTQPEQIRVLKIGTTHQMVFTLSGEQLIYGVVGL